MPLLLCWHISLRWRSQHCPTVPLYRSLCAYAVKVLNITKYLRSLRRTRESLQSTWQNTREMLEVKSLADRSHFPYSRWAIQMSGLS
jgi:hypothetical protein